MRKELVLSVSDIRYVAIECPHCRATLVLDMSQRPEFAERNDHFVPKLCPSCRAVYDSAIQPAVDALQRVYGELCKAAASISFRSGVVPVSAVCDNRAEE